ncbi:MAG TPA: serine hydrolase, partial [Phenylobacterium sp.]|nr:serine hydrolase [Phenylobacterium sp.]
DAVGKGDSLASIDDAELRQAVTDAKAENDAAWKDYEDARKAGSISGDGEMSWGGAAGTWFWVDPTNDLYFVGMVQRLGGTGGEDLQIMSRLLTYQALVKPEN